MLYAKSGDLYTMRNYFNMEKQRFPESVPYMDFLMADKSKINNKKEEQQQS